MGEGDSFECGHLCLLGVCCLWECVCVVWGGIYLYGSRNLEIIFLCALCVCTVSCLWICGVACVYCHCVFAVCSWRWEKMSTCRLDTDVCVCLLLYMYVCVNTCPCIEAWTTLHLGVVFCCLNTMVFTCCLYYSDTDLLFVSRCMCVLPSPPLPRPKSGLSLVHYHRRQESDWRTPPI